MFLYYIILYHYTILYHIILHLTFILLLIYNLFKGSNGKVKNCRGLDCGNLTILGVRLMREANGRGGNTIEGLFSSDLHYL